MSLPVILLVAAVTMAFALWVFLLAMAIIHPLSRRMPRPEPRSPK